MPDMFEDFLVDIFYNWQLKGRIRSPVSRAMLVLLRKNQNKGDQLDNSRPKAMPDADGRL